MIKQNIKFVLDKFLPTVFYTFVIFEVIAFIEKLLLPTDRFPLIYFMQSLLFVFLVCLSFSFGINTFYYQLAVSMGSTRKNFYRTSIILQVLISIISLVIFVFFSYVLTFMYDIDINFTPINIIAIFFSILFLTNISLTMGAIGLLFGKIMILIYTVFISLGTGAIGGIIGVNVSRSINATNEYNPTILINILFNYIDKIGLIIIAVSAVLVIFMSLLNYHILINKTP